jgi:DNA repair exonuclease SbcCD ATPase subunit
VPAAGSTGTLAPDQASPDPTADEVAVASIRDAEDDATKLRAAIKCLVACYGEGAAQVERAQADLRSLEDQLATLRLQRRESLPAEVRRHRLGQAVKDAGRKLANTRSQLAELAVEAQRLEEKRTELLEDLRALAPDDPMEAGDQDADAPESFEAVTNLRAELAAKDQELAELRAALAAAAKPAHPVVDAGSPAAASGTPGTQGTTAQGRVATAVAELQQKRPSEGDAPDPKRSEKALA